MIKCAFGNFMSPRISSKCGPPSATIVLCFLFVSAIVCSAAQIVVDDFSEPISGERVQPLSPNTTATDLADGLANVVGGTRKTSVTWNAPLNLPPSYITGPVAEIVGPSKNMRIAHNINTGPYASQMLLTWDANGAGLGLNLNDLNGISFARSEFDGSWSLNIRLISSYGNMFTLQTSAGAIDGYGEVFQGESIVPHEGIYLFERFNTVGAPDLAKIDRIDFELTGFGVANLNNIEFVTVPEPTWGIVVLLLVPFVYRMGHGSIRKRGGA
jgi:hypothetical protein